MLQLHRFAAALCLTACALAASPARAHPIVSTDVNRHVTLRVSGERIEIRYIYELLEIAAINTARAWDADGDGTTSAAERDAFAASLGADLVRELHVRLDGTALPLTLESMRWELGEGAMGLSTWKLYARLATRLPAAAPTGVLVYRDGLRPGEIGWKEVVLVAGGSTGIARSDVPAHDLTYELTDYAAIAELPNPNRTSASAVLRFGGAAAVPADAVSAEAAPAVPSRPARANPPRRGASPTAAAREKASEPTAADRAARPARAARGGEAPPALPFDTSPSHPTLVASFYAAWHHYAWSFFRLGVHHIATGYDHLLFLLGLLLLRQSLRRLAAVVTAFTLAHSVTLGLAAAGLVRPPGAWIELLIAASIAYVGLIALVRPRTAHGPWIALALGLVHGFGFAGALRGALDGVAGGRGWLVALASFNVGIEAFQLLVVIVLWPLLQGLDRFTWSPALRKLLAMVVLGAGLAWVVARIPALGGGGRQWPQSMSQTTINA